MGAATLAILSQRNQNYIRNNYLYNIWPKDIHIRTTNSCYCSKNGTSSASSSNHSNNTNTITTTTTKNSSNGGMKVPIIILVVYMSYAGIRGFLIGTVTGFLIGAIYRAGLFAMSTWVPLCCAVTTVLYDVVMSYSNVGIII